MGTEIKQMLDEEGVGYFPASITDAIGHKQAKAALTKFLSVYDLSLLWPTSGINGGSAYNLTKAIEVLNNKLLDTQKYPGVKAQFVNSNNRLEEWQFFGNEYAFTNELGWGQVDSAVLTELQATVFPITVNLNLSKTLLQTKNSYDVDITWSVERKGIDVSVDSIKYINSEFTNAVRRTDTILENTATTKNYTFTGTYQGLTKSITKSIKIVDPSFTGILDSSDSITAVGLSNAIYNGKIRQTSSLLGSKSYTWSSISLTNQRTVFIFPTVFGTLSSIKDGNNFEYINSYSRVNMTIDGVSYYAYVLTDPVSITGFKQIFS